MVQANQCSDLEWSGPFKNGTPSTIRNPNVFGIRAPTVFKMIHASWNYSKPDHYISRHFCLACK